MSAENTAEVGYVATSPLDILKEQIGNASTYEARIAVRDAVSAYVSTDDGVLVADELSRFMGLCWGENWDAPPQPVESASEAASVFEDATAINATEVLATAGPTPEETKKTVKVKGRKKSTAKTSTALTVPTDTEPTMAPEEGTRLFLQLTEDVIALNKDMVRNGYQMGIKLKQVRDAKLFRYGGHDTFAEYLGSLETSERISVRWSTRVIDVATNFSEQDFLDVGRKKLQIILEAVPEQRPALLQQARKGSSRREIERQVRQEHAIRRAEGRETTRTPKTEDKKITLVARTGMTQHTFSDRDSEKSATLSSLKNAPIHTTIEFENGATQLCIVYVDEKTGFVKMKTTYKRKDA